MSKKAMSDCEMLKLLLASWPHARKNIEPSLLGMFIDLLIGEMNILYRELKIARAKIKPRKRKPK